MPAPILKPASELTYAPRFEYGHMASAAPISDGSDLPTLGAGFARMKDARIPWTIKYDEVLLILEGELTVHPDDGSVTAGPMDSILLKNGTALEYEAAEALIFYAIHPATW